MYMIFDANKRLLATGDTKPGATQLGKGEYVIRLVLRHDSPAILEKMKVGRGMTQPGSEDCLASPALHHNSADQAERSWARRTRSPLPCLHPGSNARRVSLCGAGSHALSPRSGPAQRTPMTALRIGQRWLSSAWHPSVICGLGSRAILQA